MAHTHFTDEIVKEYLLYRGFSGTLKAFENELKLDKEKGFRIDRVVDGLIQYVYSYDLNGLREAWSQIENRLFGKLDQNFAAAIRKIENALLKFFLIHAVEKSNTDKVNEFFMKMTQELSGQNDWKDWFTLPFVKNPEENPTFAVYFTRQWQESLFVSLHNFLAAVYQNLPQPTLSAFEESAAKITSLQKENDILRRGLANLLPSSDSEKGIEPPIEDLIDIMDDFHNISQEIKAAESQAKTIKSFMKIGSATSVSPLSSSVAPRMPKKQLSKMPASKRSSSTDSRLIAGRSRERDSSLDTSNARVKVDPVKLDKYAGRVEGSFLFLSQDEYNDHQAEIVRLKLNGRGNLVASLDSEGMVRVWSVPPSCRTIASFSNWPQAKVLEWVLHYERYLLCADLCGKMRLLDVKETHVIWEMAIPMEEGAVLEDLISSPVESSALVLVAGKLLLLDLKTKKIEKTLDALGLVSCCTFTSNGQLIVCGFTDGAVHLIDFRKNEIVETLPPLTASLRQVQLTTDNQCCFYLAEDKQMRWASLQLKESGQSMIFPAEVSTASQKSKTFALDGTGSFLLAFGSNSGVIFKFSDQGLIKCLELGGHKAAVTCIDWCFANQCATCVTASSDGKIRISTLLIDTVSF